MQASAEEVLVISDIDDTLKISHVLDPLDVIANGLRTDSYFLGTNLVLEKLMQQNSQAKLYYVSNAVRWMMNGRHEKFILENHFPRGEVLLRESLSEKNFKLEMIGTLVRRHTPQVLILVGDNGEKDALIYEAIRLQFPKLRVLTAIHLVYSTQWGDQVGQPLRPGQRSWVTAIDLAKIWKKEGFLDSAALNELGGRLTMMMLGQNMNSAHGAIAFPKWMDCRDVFSQPLQPNPEKFVWARAYSDLMLERCLSSFDGA